MGRHSGAGTQQVDSYSHMKRATRFGMSHLISPQKTSSPASCTLPMLSAGKQACALSFRSYFYYMRQKKKLEILVLANIKAIFKRPKLLSVVTFKVTHK